MTDFIVEEVNLSRSDRIKQRVLEIIENLDEYHDNIIAIQLD